jgi:hypothetical protein
MHRYYDRLLVVVMGAVAPSVLFSCDL